VRTLILNDFTAAFREVDVLAGPTAPTAAFRIGEKSDDPLQMYLSDIFTISVNLAASRGSRALRVHGRRAADRPAADRPGVRRADAAACGHAYQLATDWHTKRPALVTNTGAHRDAASVRGDGTVPSGATLRARPRLVRSCAATGPGARTCTDLHGTDR